MELAVAFIVHLILFISTNGSTMPRSFYGVFPFAQEQLLALERELHGIQESYERLMFLKRGLSSVPSSFPSGAYLEGMEVMMYQTRAVLHNFIVSHQARRHSSNVKIAGDMISELQILQNLIQRRMNELRYTRQELSQQQQLRRNLRATSQEQESEHPSSNTESDVIHVIMPGFDRPTHLGFRRSAPDTQQQNGGHNSSAGHGSG